MKQEIAELVQLAVERGIEVRWAKSRKDVEKEGIHIVEPDIEALVQAIVSAMDHGCDTVMIYSKLTWPYQRP